MKSPPIMYAYAVFLLVCGAIAFALAGFEVRAITALIAPAVAATLMVICGAMAGKIHSNRRVGMIGVHVGLILPIVFGATFGFLSYARLTRAEPVVYLGVIFAVLAAGSLLAFIAILLTRPKPDSRT